MSMQSLVFATPWMVTVAIICARYLIFVDLLLAVRLFASKKEIERHAVYEAAWAMLGAIIITSILAHFVGRLRPYLGVPDVSLLIPVPFNSSFPSGHTATSFAIAFAIWFANKDIGIVAFAIAAFVAIGRIAVGAHYPTDILGGICVGLLSFGIVRLAHHELARRDVLRSAAQHHHDV